MSAVKEKMQRFKEYLVSSNIPFTQRRNSIEHKSSKLTFEEHNVVLSGKLTRTFEYSRLNMDRLIDLLTKD